MRFWDDFEKAGWRELTRVQSEFQSIQVVENIRRDRCLVLDGRCQLHTRDAYRYHECIAVVPFCLSRLEVKSALILGGGDGIAADMLFRCGVESITLVDLDQAVIEVSKKFLKEENNGSLENPALKTINQDAGEFVKNSSEKYDLIICDYTDVYYSGCAKLYTVEHLENIKEILNPGGSVCMQVVDPIHYNDGFWCMYNTLRMVFSLDLDAVNWKRKVYPYKVYLPYMQGMNGFMVMADGPLQFNPPAWCNFLDKDDGSTFSFAKDELPQRPINEIIPSTEQNLMYLKYTVRDGISSFREEETIYSDEKEVSL